ncbi:hypothetical protein J1N35_007907 [Gossypium stocksii]|uniref:DUF4283 domain-containing protein n=1 Tax=Gossypium stocksii TaxID=47602 RepID=A0A9D3W784_9ROSI|nr:hypothetical protein J1N35_007907 [Gossypium stocksii]
MNDVESMSDDRFRVGDDFIVDRTTKKVHFKDGSDDTLANMVVDSFPTSGVSWKDKLLNGTGSNSLDGDPNLDLEFVEGDIHRYNLNGYGALFNRITSLWKPAQPFHLMDVANIYYLIRFQCRVGYDAALSQGPWIVFGHYLTVQPSTVDFDLSRPFPCSVLAWICFPGLPGFLYQKKILEEIGSLVRIVVKLDIKTDNRERRQFARMVVFVNLEKPFTFQFLVNGQLQRVEFEALPEARTGDAFGLEMVVECKSRYKQDMIRGQKSKIMEGNLASSRFEALSSMDSESLFLNLEAPSKDLGAVRFLHEDFIKKLKGKTIGLRSESMARGNLRVLLGYEGDFGSRLKSKILEDKSMGLMLEAEANALPRATDRGSGSVGPSSMLGPIHKENILEPDSLNLTLSLPDKGSKPLLECFRP